MKKANVIASVVTENTSAETNAALVKNLGINSFVMTDADGKIIASSDDKRSAQISLMTKQQSSSRLTSRV